MYKYMSGLNMKFLHKAFFDVFENYKKGQIYELMKNLKCAL